jgi:hypothetical protein
VRLSVIFSMDSPDFGGLLCSSTAISADLWRLGQVKPGGFLRLKPTTFEHALELVDRVEDFITDVQALVGRKSEKIPTLDVTLPPSGILEGTSNTIITCGWAQVSGCVSTGWRLFPFGRNWKADMRCESHHSYTITRPEARSTGEHKASHEPKH